jgi:hypothetical protein
MTARPDYQDQQHFKKWCEGRRLRLDVRQAMWNLFKSDPEYYGNAGWTRILDEVSKTPMAQVILATGPL